ncbi:MAG: hypothetical protein J6S54_02700 [Lentisphaeria bacterium]|nr:hypothetical protein [Lentisphaeria bacterium]
MTKLIVLGPNPAWQKTLFFRDFTRGAVNRARKMETLASGKGINFCRALKCQGKSRFTLLQFSGGDNGGKLDSALQEEGMDFISIKVTGETRCCTTCLDENAQVMTELIEPSFPASADDVRAFLDSCDRELSGAAGIAFCGSLPDGTDPGMYVKAAELAAKHHALLLIDAFRDLEEVFAAAEKVLLKINKEELEKLSGEKGIEKGLKKLFSTFSSIKYAAITDGPADAFASDGKMIARYTLPELSYVASPLGCGDTASAILLSELCSGTELFPAFQKALAAASANCLNPTPGKFAPEEAAALLPEYSVRTLSDL